MTTQTKALKLALEALEWFTAAEQGEEPPITKTITAIKEALAQPEQEPTYTSTQATNCAGCGEHKHTPLRIDAMGGYVCLTCIDKKLGSMLGEFGYEQPEQEPVAWMEKNVLPLTHIIKAIVRREKDETYTEPLYTTPPQRKPLTDDEAFELIEQDYQMEEYAQAALQLIRRTEAAHGIKE